MATTEQRCLHPRSRVSKSAIYDDRDFLDYWSCYCLDCKTAWREAPEEVALEKEESAG